MSTRKLTLTRRDCDVMHRAAWLQRKHGAGIGPRIGRQFRQFAKLAQNGLLVLDGWGVDIDAATIAGRDMLVYRVTELGWTVVHQREEAGR